MFRKKFTDTINCYQLNNKIILVNTQNSKWFVINESEYDAYLKVILNNYVETSEYKSLTQKDFFVPLENYFNKTLQFYVTNKCNLKCPHCYMRCGQTLDGELSLKEKILLIREFCSNGGNKIIFTGGEVLMSPDFYDILLYTRRNTQAYIIVISNGTLWNDSLIDSCSPLIDEVQISIDGYSEISNSKIRGKGSFDKSLITIEKFISRGTSVVLAMTPLYGFEKEIEQYVSFGKEITQKYKDKKFYLVMSDGLFQGRQTNWSFSKNLRYAKSSEKILSQVYDNYIDGSFAQIHSKPIQNCGYGKIVVDSNGDYTFCTCIKNIPKIGNVRTTSMKHIFEQANEISQKTCIDNIEPCKQCDLRYICGNKCRIEFFENTDMISDISEVSDLKLRFKCNDNYKLQILLKMIDSFDLL